jgi:hypothetical protein
VLLSTEQNERVAQLQAALEAARGEVQGLHVQLAAAAAAVERAEAAAAASELQTAEGTAQLEVARAEVSRLCVFGGGGRTVVCLHTYPREPGQRGLLRVHLIHIASYLEVSTHVP